MVCPRTAGAEGLWFALGRLVQEVGGVGTTGAGGRWCGTTGAGGRLCGDDWCRR